MRGAELTTPGLVLATLHGRPMATSGASQMKRRVRAQLWRTSRARCCGPALSLSVVYPNEWTP